MSGRLDKLRIIMGEQNVSALWIPMSGPHMSEYVMEPFKRLKYISGFTGSSAKLLVTETKAALWTDSRYWIQAKKELHPGIDMIKQRTPEDISIEEWLGDAYAGTSVSADTSTLPISALDQLKKLEITPTNGNLVDLVWGDDRPTLGTKPCFVHELEYSGETVSSKVSRVQEQLVKDQVDTLVISGLDEVLWLFNIRGSDLEVTPFFLSYAIIDATVGATLFADLNRVPDSVRKHLADASVQLCAYDSFMGAVQVLSGSVWVDPDTTSIALHNSIDKGVTIIKKTSPLLYMKAVKNPSELKGFRDCHVRDAVAKTKFLAWLQEQIQGGAVVDEVDAAERLLQFRQQQDKFVSISFDAISSVGPNAAINHYHAHKETCAQITADQVYLVDSGGQYLDGTTDCTRTVHFGTPSDEEIRCNTRVLQGHINLASVKFPAGTCGSQLDALARAGLWEDSLNFAHGTGHGVGSFLNVHEHPPYVSGKHSAGYTGVPFVPGFVVTDEPGYYKEGHFGIRIESLLMCESAATEGFLQFENVTVVPIQLSFIDISLLTESQKSYLNSFHDKCRSTLAPLLKDDERALKYLNENTEKI